MAAFEIGSPVIDTSFINRKKELKLLSFCIEQQQNVMLKAPRRFGKTSLLKQVLIKTQTHTNYGIRG